MIYKIIFGLIIGYFVIGLIWGSLITLCMLLLPKVDPGRWSFIAEASWHDLIKNMTEDERKYLKYVRFYNMSVTKENIMKIATRFAIRDAFLLWPKYLWRRFQK